MSMKNRAKATVKNLEGKVQEAVGDLTGDPKTRHAVEDVKDHVLSQTKDPTMVLTQVAQAVEAITFQILPQSTKPIRFIKEPLRRNYVDGKT